MATGARSVIVPTSLLTAITLTTATSAASASASASSCTRPDGIGRHDRPVQALDGVQHRVVLGGRAHRPPAATAHGADDRRVVGLRAAPREHDLARAAADGVGDAVAGFVHRPAGIACEAVRAARVGEALGEEREHRVDRTRAHRRRRRVVEVDEPVGHDMEANGGPPPGRV